MCLKIIDFLLVYKSTFGGGKFLHVGKIELVGLFGIPPPVN